MIMIKANLTSPKNRAQRGFYKVFSQVFFKKLAGFGAAPQGLAFDLGFDLDFKPGFDLALPYPTHLLSCQLWSWFFVA